MAAAESAAWRALCLYRALAPPAEVVAAAAAATSSASSSPGGAQAAVLACVTDAVAAAHPPAPGYACRVLRAAMLAAEAAGEEAGFAFCVLRFASCVVSPLSLTQAVVCCAAPQVSDALADAYAAALRAPSAADDTARTHTNTHNRR
jgi:hypothetical protein